MNFEYTEKVKALQSRVQGFVDTHILPANQQWHDEVAKGG